VLLASGLCQVAAGQLLSESFTGTVFPPPGWVVYNKDGGPHQMERLTTHYNTPPACSYCQDETDRQCSDWICTPPLYPQFGDTELVRKPLRSAVLAAWLTGWLRSRVAVD
jgi:hypothetical protein